MTKYHEGADLQAPLRNVHEQMLELHRTLIAATRKDYERENGPVENPYTLLSLVSTDPAFAWLRPMTTLLVEMDDVLRQKEISTLDAGRIRAASAALLMPAEGEDTSFYDLVVDARRNEPELVTQHTHLRQAIGKLPIVSLPPEA